VGGLHRSRGSGGGSSHMACMCTKSAGKLSFPRKINTLLVISHVYITGCKQGGCSPPSKTTFPPVICHNQGSVEDNFYVFGSGSTDIKSVKVIEHEDSLRPFEQN
jgi:hypothetical protein